VAVTQPSLLTKEDYRLLPVGGPRYLLIDPDTQTVPVFYLQREARKPSATLGQDDTYSSPPFPGLKISGRQVFKR
jgi:hypothetical protein